MLRLILSFWTKWHLHRPWNGMVGEVMGSGPYGWMSYFPLEEAIVYISVSKKICY
jgi:hypothetical protein